MSYEDEYKSIIKLIKSLKFGTAVSVVKLSKFFMVVWSVLTQLQLRTKLCYEGWIILSTLFKHQLFTMVCSIPMYLRAIICHILHLIFGYIIVKLFGLASPSIIQFCPDCAVPLLVFLAHTQPCDSKDQCQF